MKTNWDYSELAEAYLKRPNYAPDAIEQMLSVMGLESEAKVCDVGAGVAHLSLELASRGFQVTAVEPNDQMRALGRQRTQQIKDLEWFEGTAELTGQPEQAFALVSFGSSFNVCDQNLALKETARILKSAGWFACMWNHRDLSDPIQAEIETTIRSFVPEYGYGRRREDQTQVIQDSGLFQEVLTTQGRIIHQQSIADCVTAWRSHATLHRQAGEQFDAVIDAIEKLLHQRVEQTLEIPYDTHIWFAQKNS